MAHFGCSGLAFNFTIVTACCVSALSFDVIITDVAVNCDNSDRRWFES